MNLLSTQHAECLICFIINTFFVRLKIAQVSAVYIPHIHQVSRSLGSLCLAFILEFVPLHPVFSSFLSFKILLVFVFCARFDLYSVIVFSCSYFLQFLLF